MKEKKLYLIDFLVTAILAVAFTAAPYYIESGECKITMGFWLTALVTFVIFLFTTFIIRGFLSKYDWSNKSSHLKVSAAFDEIMKKKYATLIIALIICVAWAIPIFFLYPGTFINDTWGQLVEFISYYNGIHIMTDHQPVFDTVLMSLFILPLSKLTGRWNTVVFLYVWIQTVITSLTFACTITYGYKKLDLGAKVTEILLVVYCVLPVFPAAVQNVSKDCLHSWGFVLFALMYLELIRTKGEVIKKKKFLIPFTLVILFCCLSKKVGLYVVILSLIICLVFQRNNKKYIVIPIVVSLLLMKGLMPAIMDAADIAPGGKQEMFSLPFQMTACYVKEHGDDITKEEYKILDKVLTMDTLAERYEPTNADPVKDYYQKADDKYYVKYIGVWIKQGLRHPMSYMKATCAMLSGWFSWTEYDPLMNSDWRGQQDTGLIPEWVLVRGITEKTADAYQEMYHNLYNIPFIRIFLSIGFYASIMPAFAVCTVFRKWKNHDIKYWMGICPVMFSLFLGCWLAPVSYQLEGKRYLYPVVYALPLMIMWCLYIYQNDREAQKSG